MEINVVRFSDDYLEIPRRKLLIWILGCAKLYFRSPKIQIII